MKANALGRGLDALLRGNELQVPLEELQGGTSVPTRISLAEIEANPWQPRSTFDAEALRELTDSIRINGLLQPLLVRPKEAGTGYILIAGERRYRACKDAGLEDAPAIVLEVTDIQTLALALTENIQRTDLDPIEEATGYQTLRDTFGLTQEEIASRVGKPRSTIANLLRILSLPDEIREAVKAKEISIGHARAIAGLAHEEAMLKALDTVIRRGLNVRQTEALCRDLSTPQVEAGDQEAAGIAAKDTDPNIRALTDALRNHLATQVRIVPRNEKSGRIEIEYYDLDHLDGLLRLIGVQFH